MYKQEKLQYLRDRDVLQKKIDLLIDDQDTRLLSPTGVGIGTDAKDLDFDTPFNAMIAGVIVTKNKVVDLVTGAGTVFGNPAAHCLFVVGMDTAGVLSVTQGTSAVVANALTYPTVPAGEVAIAAIYVFTAGAATFLLGTTAFDAASVTSTFTDVWGIQSLTAQSKINAMPPAF